MGDRESQVLWLGLTLIAANFFFSGAFKTLWSVFVTKPSSSSGFPSLPNIPSLPIPGIGGIPPLPVSGVISA